MNRLLLTIRWHFLRVSGWACTRAAYVACLRTGKAGCVLCVCAIFLVLTAPALPAHAGSAQGDGRSATSLGAQRWTAVVLYVVDGDTLRVRRAPGAPLISVRIEGMDAPESCQPGGTNATYALRTRIQGQTVALVGQRRDAYGRVLARVWLGQQDVGRWMVSQGHAWSYRSARNPGPYAAEEQSARAAGYGVFARGLGPAMEPARFRKAHGPCDWAKKNAQRPSHSSASKPKH